MTSHDAPAQSRSRMGTPRSTARVSPAVAQKARAAENLFSIVHAAMGCVSASASISSIFASAAALLLAFPLAGCGRAGGPGASASSGTALRHSTGRSLDLAIDGPGYFVLETRPGAFVFTRVGNFYTDVGGTLINGDGYTLMPAQSIPPGASDVRVTPAGKLMARGEAAGAPQEVGGVTVAVFADPSQLDRDGIYFTPTSGSGEPRMAHPGTGGAGTLRGGELEGEGQSGDGGASNGASGDGAARLISNSAESTTMTSPDPRGAGLVSREGPVRRTDGVTFVRVASASTSVPIGGRK